MHPFRSIVRAASTAAAVASAALLGYSSGRAGGGGGANPRQESHASAATSLLPTPPPNLPAPLISPPPSKVPPAPSERAREILRYGVPTSDGVKFFDDFVLAYDRRLRIPAWVFERLTAESRPGQLATIDRTAFEFYEDLGQHPYFRAGNADYAKSGYDRGHLAAAGNHKVSRNACLQTFILSNICPQVGHGFNRHVWNSLERYVRSLTKHYAAVYVCSGPLFLPSQHEGSKRKYVQYEVLGSNFVAVPTHFFKVVLLESHGGQFELLSFLVPNMAHPVDPEPSLDLFLVPLDAIERAAGFLIFDQLPRNRLTRVNKRPTG